MDKDKILDYVRKTPANTNPNVLKTMLDGGSGGGEYSISKQVVFDESVTTVGGEGLAAYTEFIPSAPIVGAIEVEFNGTIYTMEGVGDGCKRYGAPYDEHTEAYDWSQYPFSMYVCPDSEQVNLNTETAGTYTLKITSDVATVTDEFRMAVQAAMGSSGGGDPGYSCKTVRRTLFNGNVTTTANESKEPPHGVYANATVPIDETIKADSIVVIFEGVEYTCVNDGSQNYYTYGAPYNDDEDIFDWSNFPFNVTNSEVPGGATFTLTTENAGTYNVKIETVEDTVEITPCFKKAVKAAIIH